MFDNCIAGEMRRKDRYGKKLYHIPYRFLEQPF
jgi:hypothetical protein